MNLVFSGSGLVGQKINGFGFIVILVLGIRPLIYFFRRIINESFLIVGSFIVWNYDGNNGFSVRPYQIAIFDALKEQSIMPEYRNFLSDHTTESYTFSSIDLDEILAFKFNLNINIKRPITTMINQFIYSRGG